MPIVFKSGLWGDSPSDFERGRCHWGEFCCNGEDAVEFAIGERCCQGGGDAGKDSVFYVSGTRTIILIRMQKYLVLPNRTSATPSSSPKESWISRKESRARPSKRISSWRASIMKARSLFEGSASRGILRSVLGGFEATIVVKLCAPRQLVCKGFGCERRTDHQDHLLPSVVCPIYPHSRQLAASCLTYSS